VNINPLYMKQFNVVGGSIVKIVPTDAVVPKMNAKNGIDAVMYSHDKEMLEVTCIKPKLGKAIPTPVPINDLRQDIAHIDSLKLELLSTCLRFGVTWEKAAKLVLDIK